MRKDLLAIGLGMVLSGVTVFSSLAQNAVRLHGQVPMVVARGQARAMSRVDDEKTVELSIGLPLRNRTSLTNLLNQIYDPASANYGHYLTPQQFAEHFGPTEKDYQAVIEFARKNGLKVTRTHANRMLVDVSGRAADVERAFAVTLNQYQHPTEAREFFAPDREPSVPAGLQIQDVGGLDDYRRPHPHYHLKSGMTPIPLGTQIPKTKANTANPNATTGSGPSGDYIGDDFRRAYIPGSPLDGTGQAVALVQFDGYFSSDISAYEALAGRPNVPLQNVLIDGFSGNPTGSGGEVEVSLDIEMVVSMAPNISKIILYEGNPFNFHPNDVLNQIAEDNAARQVSSSWGWNGGPNLTTDQIFQQMALQGQTYFNATGDSDAFLPGQLDDPTQITEPSSNPFITQVGATTLAMNGAGRAYNTETVWNWGVRNAPLDDGIGSSGGISTFYSIPSWQTNINMGPAQGSTTFRNVPDVAMTGDDVFVIADGGFQFPGTGGTSCAAPLWGAFTALLNQQAALNGRQPIGFINPALYSIATNIANYGRCFHDVRTGNSEWSLSPNLFSATIGYDLCTGLGTPNGTNLINALIGQPTVPIHISPPPPPYGTTMSAVSGGNANGSWFMFVQDDAPISSGFINNGWILSLTTADLVGTSADLELLMSTANSSAFSGQPVTFVLTVTNYGPSISTNATVVDNLPLGVTVISTNTTQGSVTRSGSTLLWNIGTLNVGAGAQLLLTVQPPSFGSFVNSANTSAGTPDPNPDDDFKIATVNVLPLSTTLAGSFASSNQLFSISIPGPTNSGLTVIIQATTNLANPNWVNIYTSTPPINFTDPVSSNYVRRFYRAQLVP
ncbi:MAG TPA: protease pro-enzyme activation domain-containing protein [Verrucomicrobiae bacterium]|nr:protease pro-enzyme activation domain-containing protein [Verrucomicrobiae bacterium]